MRRRTASFNVNNFTVKNREWTEQRVQKSAFNVNKIVKKANQDLVNKTKKTIKKTIEEVSFVITASWLSIIHSDAKKSLDKFEQLKRPYLDELDALEKVYYTQNTGGLDNDDLSKFADESCCADTRMTRVASSVPISLFTASFCHMNSRTVLPSDERVYDSPYSLTLLAFFSTLGIKYKDREIDFPCLFIHELICLENDGRGYIYTCYVENINFYNFGVYKTGNKIYVFLPTSGEYLFEFYADFHEINSLLSQTLILSLDIECGDGRRNYALFDARCDVKEITFS